MLFNSIQCVLAMSLDDGVMHQIRNKTFESDIICIRDSNKGIMSTID